MSLRTSPERRALVAVWVLLLVQPLLVAQDDLTGPVGALGDPKRLQFEGNSTFSADEVRGALMNDWAVQLASTPSASLRDYVKLLPVRLAEGYHASGFADAAVTADMLPDRAGIVLRIKEGSRYPSGDVRVVNAKAVDAELLVKALTTPPAQERWPVRFGAGGMIAVTEQELNPESVQVAWTAGQPAPFGAMRARSLQQRTQQALAQQGFFWAEFSATVRPEGGKGVLHIDIVKEGPRAVIGEIAITGHRRNSREEIIEAIDARVGLPLNLSALRTLQQKLWHSGRFSEHTLAVQPAANPGEARLFIALREIERLPLLKEALSPTEQALLRFHEWIESLDLSDEEMVIAMRHPEVEIRAAVGRRSGMAARFSTTHGDGAAFGVVTTPGQIGTYALHQKRKFVSPPGDHRILNTVRLKAVHDKQKDRTHFSFLLGSGFASRRQNQPSQPIETIVQAYPSAALLLAHHPDHKCELAGDTLTITTGGMVLTIDAATGRLREGHTTAGPDSMNCTVTFERKAVQREVGRLEAEVTANNEYDPKRPLGSCVAFHGEQLLGFCAELSPQRTPEQRINARKAFAKLLSPELFAPLDALVMDSARPYSERLRIPLSPELLPLAAQPSSMFAMGIPWCDDLFARGSWPWVVSRETLLMLGGMSRYSVQELAQLERSDLTGPVGCLGAAIILRQANLTLSRSFAYRGLDLLSADAFARDCRVLLHGDSPQAQILRQVAANVRALSPEEAAIASRVAEPYGPLILRLHQALQPHKHKPIDEAIEAIARDYWTAHLRPIVERRLRQLSKPPQPTGGKL